MAGVDELDVAAIAMAMSDWVPPGDPEIAHSEADQLLVNLVRLLCPDELTGQVETILADYERVEKWYA